MSNISERARVAVLLCDYAGADAISKVNALGLGWAVTGINPSTGTTAPMTVLVFVDTPPDMYGQEFAITLTLRDAAGKPVELPGPAGNPQAMRLAQNVRAEEPSFPSEANVPRHAVWAHSQMVFNLLNGLPLQPGQLYTWTVEIDSTRLDGWSVSFYVSGPRPGLVFGGPANPADIPDLDEPT